jgi:Family of unknown function (DUF5722)
MITAMALLVLGCRSWLGAADLPLTVAGKGHHQVTVMTPADGVWEIATTGGDPFIATTSATPADLAVTPVLAFDYVCVSGLNLIDVFAGPGWSGERQVHAEPLPAREGWSPFSLDVASNAQIAASRPSAWRIDLGSQPGKVIQIRNLRLRARTAEELKIAAEAQAKQAQDRAWDKTLKDYLAQDFPGALTKVAADATSLTISGTVPIKGEVRLAEWPIWQAADTTITFATTWPVRERGFSVTVPRIAEDGSDRALSRFVLIQRHGTQDTLLSHGRWVDVIPAATTLPPGVQRSKKGLGGFSVGGRPLSDLDELNIGSITVNVMLSQFFQAGPGDGAEALSAGGRTWYLRKKAFDGLDATMLEAAKRNIVVLGIILVAPARQWGAKELGALMQHPDYESSGIFTMPNLTTAASTAAYTLALDLLAKRYSRADGKYGRMHHWIMHNEVDMGWVWTNCGKRPELVFFDQYYRSMRLAHAILRRQDPNAQVFISLTHHWAETGDPSTCFPSRNLLGHLLALSQAEGDFEWGLAHHPYPSSLLEPKTWLDKGAEFRLDTPKVTFRNVEVLDAWARQPAALFQGKKIRAIHLSEQGPNSPDYSEKSLTEQAAAMAYVWKKIAKLDTIHGFEYHNWVDNRGEGGLRIGLRRFPDDQEKPLGTKPVWDVYKALGTPDEDRACAFALPVIGLKDWGEAIHHGPIPASKSP